MLQLIMRSQGTLYLLEALRRANLTSSTKFFNAGSRYLLNFVPAERSLGTLIASAAPCTAKQPTPGTARYLKLRRCRSACMPRFVRASKVHVP